eukprot:CAMPEP_0115098470 /NCGR_PEP_ID=MMETSP0227-20121206/31184_1 /TAXON_ID=89957 /ORGANISM="Polarella glacialis, Strain CCMP 1383" /LENGTH=59 /DNA_ID=CAMNT_0002493093 /DNA_START=87 /DNA_END=266 /DNA_ORIENTATION=-
MPNKALAFVKSLEPTREQLQSQIGMSRGLKQEAQAAERSKTRAAAAAKKTDKAAKLKGK